MSIKASKQTRAHEHSKEATGETGLCGVQGGGRQGGDKGHKSNGVLGIRTSTAFEEGSGSLDNVLSPSNLVGQGSNAGGTLVSLRSFLITGVKKTARTEDTAPNRRDRFDSCGKY